MAENLYGWHRYPHQRRPYPPPWMNSLCSSATMRTWTFPQNLQMYLWCPMNEVLRNDYWSREGQDGPKETGCYQILEFPHFCQSHMILHRVHQLLPKIHTKLLEHHCPPQSSHSKEWTLGLDETAAECLWNTQTNILLHPSPPNLQHHPSLHCHDWCLPPHHRGRTHANWWQWRPSPLCLLFQNLCTSWMKLQYLWPGTPCCHFSSRWMVTIPLRHHPSSHHHHWSQEPILYKGSQKIVLSTSLLVSVFTGFWYPLAGHTWYMDDTRWCPFPKRPHWHHWWQCWHHHHPRSSGYPSSWPFPCTPYQILFLFQPPHSESDPSCAGWFPSIPSLSPCQLDL